MAHSHSAARDSFFGDLKAHGRDAFGFYTDKKVTISRWYDNAPVLAGHPGGRAVDDRRQLPRSGNPPSPCIP
jgi:hypothetical protein